VLCAIFGLALFLALLFLAPSPVGAEPPKKPVSFINDVAPILRENCFACHDTKKNKGKLNMTTYESLRKGGDKEDPITPGKPDESLLIDLVTAKGASRMPPKEAGPPLSKQHVAVLEQWIKDGATLDADIAPKADLFRELRLRWKPPAPPAKYQFPITITALAFTPDQQKLVVGGQHELTVWDVKQGQLQKRIATRAERAKAMLFLPDGKLVVAGGRPGQEGDVRIYDLEGGMPRVQDGVAYLDGANDSTVMVKQLLDADDEVLCLALSSDGKRLASGGCDRIVHVWDLSGGYADAKLEQSIENHADWVLGLAFSPDGKSLLTASRDKTAKVWDLQSKESILTFPDHQAPVYGVAVSRDGKVGISVGEDKQVRFWNAVGDPKQIRAVGGHTDTIIRILACPQQPILVTCGDDNTVRVWDADKRSLLRTLNGHTDFVFALALSSDGSLIASGSYNGEVRISQLADGSLAKAFSASPGLQAAGSAEPDKKK
jgi:WD40 repeat protein